MNIQPQIIEKDGKPAFVVLTIEDYESLLSDEALLDRARENDAGRRYPAAIVDRIIDGDNPLKVIREWRGITQDQLAAKAGMSKNYMSMLETGKRTISKKTAMQLAAPLDVDADILLDEG